MLTKNQKISLVDDLGDRFQRQKVTIFTDIRGTSVAKLTQFRRELRKLSAEFKVAKKTLLNRSLEKAGISLDSKPLEGEIGVIFGYEDQALPAKAAVKFGKENATFKVLKGILSGKIIEAKEVIALARLPSREMLLATVARAMNGPVQGLVNVLQGNVRNLVVVLNKIKESRK